MRSRCGYRPAPCECTERVIARPDCSRSTLTSPWPADPCGCIGVARSRTRAYGPFSMRLDQDSLVGHDEMAAADEFTRLTGEFLASDESAV